MGLMPSILLQRALWISPLCPTSTTAQPAHFCFARPRHRFACLLFSRMSFVDGVSLPLDKRLGDLLNACTKSRSLQATKLLHALTITLGPYARQPIFLWNNVIALYAGLGELRSARKAFDGMLQRNVVSYNALITSYSRCGNVEEAWSLLSALRGHGFSPTQHTFAGLLSCAALDLSSGVQLQGMVLKNGLYHADPFVGTALLNLYGRHGCLDQVVEVFEDMPSKSLVTWNSMLSLFGHHGYCGDCFLLIRDLMRDNVVFSEYTFMGVLSGCLREQDLALGEQIHCLVIKTAFDSFSSVVNSLMNMYVKCADVSLAGKLIEELHVRDAVSWNTIIGAWAKYEKNEAALDLFVQMSMDGLLPNQATFVSAVHFCTGFEIPSYGEFMHAKIMKHGFQYDVTVGGSLVNFYVKLKNLKAARRCFDETLEKNVVTWNALLSGYSNICSFTSASMLREMFRLGYRPNEFSFSSVLKRSFVIELQQFHCMITKMGYERCDYVLSSLISSYTKNRLISSALALVKSFSEQPSVVASNVIAGLYNRTGRLYDTLKLLSALEEPDIVSWNIAIEACARNGNYEEVFELFKYMHMLGIQADNYTFVSLLTACCRLCNLSLGSSIHGLITKTDFSCCDTLVCNVMMDMYGKCGCLGSTLKVFEETPHINIISWTVLISALGVNGQANEALEMFKETESQGFEPDGIAFTAVLTACRHGGLVREGLELFRQMKLHHNIDPEMDHYNVMVDLLAGSGHLKEAEEIIMSMPFPPSAMVWRSFLDGCKRQCKDQMLQLAE